MYKPHEYGEVILPLTVLRRFDCILADTKLAVLDTYNKLKDQNLDLLDGLLYEVAGHKFYNISKYTFKTLLDDPDNIESKVVSIILCKRLFILNYQTYFVTG